MGRGGRTFNGPVPILPWRHSTSSPWADSPISDTPALRDLLQILARLIGMHEVKLAKNLIQELSSGPLAAASLAISKEELCSMLYRFGVQKRQDGDAGLIELSWFCGVKTMVSEAGSAAGDRAAGAPSMMSNSDSASSPGKGGLANVACHPGSNLNCPEQAEAGLPSESFLRHAGRTSETGQLGGVRRSTHGDTLHVENLDMAGGFEAILEERPPSRSSFPQDRPPSRLFLADGINPWEAQSTSPRLRNSKSSTGSVQRLAQAGPANPTNRQLRFGDTEVQERPTTRIQHSCATASGIPPSSVIFTPVEEIEIETEVLDEVITMPLSTDRGESVARPSALKAERTSDVIDEDKHVTIQGDTSRQSEKSRATIAPRVTKSHNWRGFASSRLTSRSQSQTFTGFLDRRLWMKVSHANPYLQNLEEGRQSQEKLRDIWEHDAQDVSIPSHFFLVHPNGHLRMTWDALALIAIMCEAVTIPINTCWEVASNEILIWIMTAFFCVDMVMNFITGFFQDGIMVMKLRKICRQYLTGWFFIDFISTFPWGIAFSDGRNATFLKFAKIGKLMRVLRLLRIAKLNVLLKRIEELFCSSAIIVAISLLKMVFGFLLICHWCACFWGWLGHPDRYFNVYTEEFRNSTGPIPVQTCEPGGPCEPSIQGSPWRRRYAVEQESIVEQYLFSLRFSAALFTGGDMGIQPGYWIERLFVVLMMFVSFILCSTILSQIVLIFHKINEDSSAQADMVQSFKEFMVAGHVPFQLQQKVKRYLEYQFRSRKNLQVNDARRFEMMERLSPWLRKELQVHLNHAVLVQHPFFLHMPAEVLAHTCTMARSELCAPSDVVAQKGQLSEKMYFVVKGTLHITSQTDHPQSLKSNASAVSLRRVRSWSAYGFTISAPGYVGALSLFREEVREYTIVSMSHCELLTICRSDLTVLQEEFPGLKGYVKNFQEELRKAEEEGTSAGQDCSIHLHLRSSDLET